MHQVSFITRTYNSAATIERTLDSVLAQTVDPEHYEIVVVDDGSTDRTAAIVSKYIERNPSVVRFVPTEHSGPTSTLNAGIEQASGECVTVLDADDYLLDAFLERTLAVLRERSEVDFVYTDYYEETLNSERRYVDTSESLFSTVANGIVFRRNALSAVGLYDESLVFPEYDVLAKLMKQGRTGHHIATPLFVYNRQEDSLTTSDQRVERGKRELRERYGEDFAFRDY